MLTKIIRKIANITALFKYPKISSNLEKERSIYFFFHAWSFGGAERVHIDILRLFRAQKPLCIITDRSKNQGFRKEFEAAADVINLGRWAEKLSYKAHLHKKIANIINNQKAPVLFGCNSSFMYELIPLLKPHVKIIDLIHNFSDKKEGAEWFSIPYVPRLDHRIVVGKRIVDQFKELYKLNHIPDHYLDRITVILNRISFDNFMPKKNYDNVLEILFVARNSIEKRVNVFIRIAELCGNLELPVKFKMIGNFEPYQKTIPSNTEIIGEVHDKEVLNNYYKKAHLLLLTSYREGWGLVIFEGMSFGVVPISTDVSELSDHISTEKENGVLIENLQQEEELALLFVAQIDQFVHDRDLLKKFSKNAFETVKQLAEQSDFDNAYRNIILGDTP